ncbi:hypothetical protein [Numidum massiliense]|uniref:hypothetical protein n=1 Tax=Numidum massiliense TaxID=1522315 RepID=UPI0006D5AAD8|nr:hypothetical protein [Numidum massiliense]
MNYQSKEHDKMKGIPEGELPQVTAFQDEFTRKFMDSTEPVQEGYYLFRSGVNGFTMLFPENAKMADKVYSAPGDHYEYTSFGGDYGLKESNEVYSVDIKYQNDVYADHVDSQLNSLRRFLKDGEFEEISMSGKTIYYGSGKKEFEHENDTVYAFFSYIKAKERHQGIRFMYSATCQDAEKPCNLDVEKEEEKAKRLMESVTFIDADLEERSDQDGE